MKEETKSFFLGNHYIRVDRILEDDGRVFLEVRVDERLLLEEDITDRDQEDFDGDEAENNLY